MELRQLLAHLVDIHKEVHIVGQRETRQRLAQVGLKGLAIAGGMQQPIHIVENHLSGDVLGAIQLLHMMQHPVGDAVVTDVAVGIRAVEQCHLRLSVLFIPIHWKTLTFFYIVKTWYTIGNQTSKWLN